MLVVVENEAGLFFVAFHDVGARIEDDAQGVCFQEASFTLIPDCHRAYSVTVRPANQREYGDRSYISSFVLSVNIPPVTPFVGAPPRRSTVAVRRTGIPARKCHSAADFHRHFVRDLP